MLNWFCNCILPMLYLKILIFCLENWTWWLIENLNRNLMIIELTNKEKLNQILLSRSINPHLKIILSSSLEKCSIWKSSLGLRLLDFMSMSLFAIKLCNSNSLFCALMQGIKNIVFPKIHISFFAAFFWSMLLSQLCCDLWE